MYKLNRDGMGKELKLAVVETLQDLMKTNDKIVALEADLGGASGFAKFEQSNPNRYVQCGIAEANMVGVSAGLSATGYIPFMHTFGPFATRRVFDQIFLSGAYAKNTMNIYGSDPGFTVGPNGGTHTTWEDVAMMRTIPNAVVCDPADYVQLEWLIKEFATMEGVHYVRANRKNVRNVYAEGSTFEIGKGNLIKEGKDVLIVVAGQLVSDALDCADTLEVEGISVSVIDMFTIKPIDAQLLIKEATDKKAVVTFENHSIIGGLGSAVAEVLMENQISTAFKRVGVDEQFGQVGTPEFLQNEFKLTAKDLAQTIRTLVK